MLNLINNKHAIPFEVLVHFLVSVITITLLFTSLPTLLPIYKVIFSFILVGIIGLDSYTLITKNKKYLLLTKRILIFSCTSLSALIIVFYISKFVVYTDTYGIESVLRGYEEAAKYIFLLICFAQPIFLPTPEAVTIPAGSLVFGPFSAAVLGFLGTISGIILMFLIARIGGLKLVSKFVQEKHLKKYQDYAGKNEMIILTILFIIPILPDEIICVGAGLSGVSFKRFLVIAIISKFLTTSILAYSVQLVNLFP